MWFPKGHKVYVSWDSWHLQQLLANCHFPVSPLHSWLQVQLPMQCIAIGNLQLTPSSLVLRKKLLPLWTSETNSSSELMFCHNFFKMNKCKRIFCTQKGGECKQIDFWDKFKIIFGRNMKLCLAEIWNYIWQKYEECAGIRWIFPPLLQLNENILDTKLKKLRRIFGRNVRNSIFYFLLQIQVKMEKVTFSDKCNFSTPAITSARNRIRSFNISFPFAFPL